MTDTNKPCISWVVFFKQTSYQHAVQHPTLTSLGLQISQMTSLLLPLLHTCSLSADKSEWAGVINRREGVGGREA